MLWIAAVCVILLWLVINLVQSERGQTWLAREAASFLSKELKTEIRIDKVKIHLGRSVDLYGLYVQDLHKDTLLYAGTFQVKISTLSLRQKDLRLKSILLRDAFFNHVKYKGEKEDNLAFIIRYFSSTDTTQKTSAPWHIVFPGEAGIGLDNVHFRHILEDHPKTEGVDFSHLDVHGIYGTLRDVNFKGDSAWVNIDKLRFTDHSGFRLDELSVHAKVAPDEMNLQKLVIRTPYTDLHTDLVFRYDSIGCFDEFFHGIHFQSDFTASRISFRDIGFFAPDVQKMKPDVTMSGRFKGTVNNFKGKDVVLRFGTRSSFVGNIAMKGLPEIDETFMEIDALSLLASKTDLESLRFPGEEPGNRLSFPSNFEKLGLVHFKGRFTGFTNDFVAFGDMQTAIGYISTDINLKFNRAKNETSYRGHLSTRQFNAGAFWDMADAGTVTLSADVQGTGLTIEKMNTTLKGNIGSLIYRGYEYKDISVNAAIERKLFNGTLAVHEPNADLDFKGKINFQGQRPVFNFTAAIASLQLDKLNLLPVKGDANFSCLADIELTGDKIDNLAGSLSLHDINYREDKVLYHVNELRVHSTFESSGERIVNIFSDNVDADFRGRFEFKTLGIAFGQVLPRYLPALLPLAHVVPSRQDFDFDIHLKNTSLLTRLFLPGWSFDANTTLKGSFNSIENSFHFSAASNEIRYNNLRLLDMNLEGKTDGSAIHTSLRADRLYYADSSFVEQPSLQARASENKVDFALRVADSTLYASRAFLHGNLVFDSPHRYTVELDTTFLVLNQQTWTLSPGNRIVFDTSAVAVSGFQLSKGNELVSLGGTLSKSKNDKIAVGLRSFRLENMNPFLGSSGTVLNGIADGSFFLEKGVSSFQLQADVTVDSLRLNGDTLGKAMIHSSFDDEDKVLSLNASIQRGTAITLVATGEYRTAKKDDNLSFDIRLNSIYLNTFSQYVGSVVSELKGKVSADLRLTGSPEKPVMDGEVHLVKASCRVNYLGTRYSFTDDVRVEENKFVFKDFSLNDEHGKQALINGEIRHNYFKNFFFDLGLRATDFECLNTNALQNELYYGKAIASGYATFRGELDNMDISITMSSRKGTVISIPLGGGEELSQNEFITFVKKSTGQDEDKSWTPPSGVSLDMSFNVTPDAEMRLIFDEKIGDVINGNGRGDIRLSVGSDGTFKMYGSYNIDKGTYLFTLRNIINKKFQIEKGGSITWTGDPYNADINMNATYKVYTSTLYNLINDSTYRKRLEVDCRLSLTNKLMNPTIHYEINVPGVDGAAQSQISSVLNSEAEVSKQFFGLLVLNQFIPQGNSNQSASALDASSVNSNLASLLSNQGSNWLSQLNLPVNVAVDYQAKDVYSQDQWKVILGKSFLNDRLVVDGSFVAYSASTAQSTNNALGDFNAEYKLGQDGKFRIKAFNHSNENSTDIDYAPYTQGLGVSYREEFDSLRELLIRWRLKKKDPAPTGPTTGTQ